MRSIGKLILWTTLILFETACVNHLNLNEGITSFREQNYRQAFIRLMPEAKKGIPDAQYAIGYMYYYGQGVVEDRKKAWFWITRAAEAGQPDALEAMQVLINDRKAFEKNKGK